MAPADRELAIPYRLHTIHRDLGAGINGMRHQALVKEKIHKWVS